MSRVGPRVSVTVRGQLCTVTHWLSGGRPAVFREQRPRCMPPHLSVVRAYPVRRAMYRATVAQCMYPFRPCRHLRWPWQTRTRSRFIMTLIFHVELISPNGKDCCSAESVWAAAGYRCGSGGYAGLNDWLTNAAAWPGPPGNPSPPPSVMAVSTEWKWQIQDKPCWHQWLSQSLSRDWLAVGPRRQPPLSPIAADWLTRLTDS